MRHPSSIALVWVVISAPWCARAGEGTGAQVEIGRAAIEREVRLRADYYQVDEGALGAPRGQLLGYGGRLELRRILSLAGGDLRLRIDARAREDLERQRATRREVVEAYLALKDAGRLSLTLGRQAFGEGFGLLLVDGVKVGVRYDDWIVHEVIGGLGAEFDDLTPDADRPTVGTGAQIQLDEWLEGAGSVTWSRERIAPTNRDALGETNRDVLTAAGRAFVYPVKRVWIFLSGELADVGAYQVPQDDPQLWLLEEQGFTVTEGFGQVGWRPLRPLKLDASYLFHTDRFEAPDQEARFQDISARARWRFWRRFRLMGRIRLRRRGRITPVENADGSLRLGREDDDAVRLQIALDLPRIGGTGFGAAASYMSDRGAQHDKQAAAAEAGYDHAWLSLFAGWRSVARERGDEFSSFRSGSDPDTVYPYSRAVSHAAYLRGGARYERAYLQLTGDHNLSGGQTAVFVQVGRTWR